MSEHLHGRRSGFHETEEIREPCNLRDRPACRAGRDDVPAPSRRAARSIAAPSCREARCRCPSGDRRASRWRGRWRRPRGLDCHRRRCRARSPACPRTPGVLQDLVSGPRFFGFARPPDRETVRGTGETGGFRRDNPRGRQAPPWRPDPAGVPVGRFPSRADPRPLKGPERAGRRRGQHRRGQHRRGQHRRPITHPLALALPCRSRPCAARGSPRAPPVASQPQPCRLPVPRA